MARKILLCGGNGAGKSTLAAALAALSGYKYADVEEYYFPRARDGYAYGAPRTKGEAEALLLADLDRYDDFIFTSVTGSFGGGILARFTHVVFVSTPKALRMERVVSRSYQKFGGRMRPGGDLYEKEQGFFQMVQSRPDRQVEDWLEGVSLPVIRVDGTRPARENAAYILREL